MAIQTEAFEISILQLDSFTEEVMLMQTCCLHALYGRLQILKQSIKKIATVGQFSKHTWEMSYWKVGGPTGYKLMSLSSLRILISNIISYLIKLNCSESTHKIPTRNPNLSIFSIGEAFPSCPQQALLMGKTSSAATIRASYQIHSVCY